jgi:predicted transcriptional regulator
MGSVLTVRLEEELSRRLQELAAEKHANKSDLVREALRDYLDKEQSLSEIRGLASERFAEGKIGFDDLVQVLGYEEAKTVAYYTDVAERSFDDGL